MSRRFQPKSTPGDNLRVIMNALPWKLLILLPILVVVGIPTYLIGTHLGGKVMPSLTNFFYTITDVSPQASPTPLPSFSTVLPQVGPVLYTVGDGDSCDSVLVFQMHMNKAGEIFSDVKPETVRALNESLGHDCHNLQPGTMLPLMPHYPLAALGGVVLKIQATTPQQVLPTPLIRVTSQPQTTADCSGGCLLTVRIAPQTQVQMVVETDLPVRPGSWVWAQVALARKKIQGFDNYPYVDPTSSLSGTPLHGCDLQVDNTHDDNGTSCDQLQPNTIDDDGGGWLVGVIGASGLDHWHYPIQQPPGTHVMLWLNVDPHTGNLKYQAGNPIYRYDEASHLYVKIST